MQDSSLASHEGYSQETPDLILQHLLHIWEVSLLIDRAGAQIPSRDLSGKQILQVSHPLETLEFFPELIFLFPPTFNIENANSTLLFIMVATWLISCTQINGHTFCLDWTSLALPFLSLSSLFSICNYWNQMFNAKCKSDFTLDDPNSIITNALLIVL